MRATCLTHVPFEGPGIFATSLSAQGLSLERYLVPADGLPSEAGDLLLVMGGPMSANDPDPWIAAEIDFIAHHIKKGVLTLGICLGSQLIAKALGAQIRPGSAFEIGMTPITLTTDARTDPLFSAWPEQLSVFEWHGEVFDLPLGAVPLAGSEVAPLQAFRYARTTYGLLFHLELAEPDIQSLCRACPGDLERAKRSETDLLAQAIPTLPTLHRLAGQLMTSLLAAAR